MKLYCTNLSYYKTVLLLFLIWPFSCSVKEDNRYENAITIIKNYLNLDSLNENEMILVLPKNTGCLACRNYFLNNLNSISSNRKLNILTDNKFNSNIKDKIIFDTLGLINTTDLGFEGPALFVKKNNQLEFLIEIKIQNKDTILRSILY